MRQKDEPIEEDYATEHLQGLFARPRCKWCKDPLKIIYRVGYCRSCHKIRSELRQLKWRFEEDVKNGEDIHPGLEFQLKTVIKMARLVKLDGEVYGNLHIRSVDGLNVEYIFRKLSDRFVHEDLFHHYANLFDWSFSPSEKRMIYYLLSILIRKDNSRRRRHLAYYAEGIDPKRSLADLAAEELQE